MIAKFSIASFVVVTLTLLSNSPDALGAAHRLPKSSGKPLAQPFTFSNPSPGLLALRYQDRPILVYASETNQFKPYVKELYTLRGDNVLVDAPADHLHHHGLMYATYVNGINFWEERGPVGFQKPFGPPQTEISRSSSGKAQAVIKQVIHWIGPDDASKQDTSAAALLVETRTLTVTLDEKTQEVALLWHAKFQAGPAAPKITLTGPSYNGLGLRLPSTFNLVAQHENSEAAAYPTNGKGDVTRARWSAVSHELNGHPVTVAIFGQPSASRGLPAFFTMVQPFTYLAVTQGLDKAPLEYAAGDTFTLEYLLVAYADRKAPPFLNQRSQLWHP